MNDKEFKEQKKRVKNILDMWIEIMGLKWYEIRINYKMGDSPEREGGFSPMRVLTNWEYRLASIDIWVEGIPDDNDKLERMLVHELCHIFVNPMRGCNECFDISKEEYAVESLSRAFIWVKYNCAK